MKYWWVNHKQTRDHEVRGGYLWSPRTKANGHRSQFYENMTEAEVGDVVFSFADGKIGAAGVVTEAASPCPKPDEFGTTGEYWSRDGWMVSVDFRDAINPLRPKDYIGVIQPLLPATHSPL